MSSPPPLHACIVCPIYFRMFGCRLFSETVSGKQPLYTLEIVAPDKRCVDSDTGRFGSFIRDIKFETRRGGGGARWRPLGKLTIQVRILASAKPCAELFSSATPREYEHSSLRLILRRASLFVTATSPQHRSTTVEIRLVPSAEIESKATTFCRARAVRSVAGLKTIMHLHSAANA